MTYSSSFFSISISASVGLNIVESTLLIAALILWVRSFRSNPSESAKSSPEANSKALTLFSNDIPRSIRPEGVVKACSIN